jgi:hypothetical protein
VSPGVESPVTEVSFGGAASLHVVGRVGTGPAVSASGGKASLPIQGTDTFQFIAGTDGVHQVRRAAGRGGNIQRGLQRLRHGD